MLPLFWFKYISVGFQPGCPVLPPKILFRGPLNGPPLFGVLLTPPSKLFRKNSACRLTSLELRGFNCLEARDEIRCLVSRPYEPILTVYGGVKNLKTVVFWVEHLDYGQYEKVFLSYFIDHFAPNPTAPIARWSDFWLWSYDF